MLLGGWGESSIDRLELDADRVGATLDRCGAAGIVGASGSTDHGWRCWLSGRLTNVDELWKRFPGPGRVDLNALCARAHAAAGASACNLLRGTFVLVAVDLERDTAFVSRDQLGGRPLAFSRFGDGALFAEHERDILNLLPSTPEPDRQALQHWIDVGTIPPGRTLFGGVHRLPPAHHLVLSASGVTVERYWAPHYQGTVTGSRQEIAERLRVGAFAAVGRAGAGSRRIAVQLSGGLDSACVAAGLAARRQSASEAIALSAVFPSHPETDESDLIDAVARHTGLAIERVAFDERSSILSPAVRHIVRWRVPPVSPNLFVWEPVMAAARRIGVDVVLDGEGGDELFRLAPYLIADMIGAGRLYTAWSLAGGIPGMGGDPDRRLKLRALRVFGVGGLVPDWARRWRSGLATSPTRGSLLLPEDRSSLVELEHESRGRELDGPRWWQSLAAELTSAGEDFDVAAHMRREAHDDGVDRRHPFLFDRDLVDVVLTNPPQMQFDPVRDRPLLRDGLDGYIPDQVRERYEKSHFTPLLLSALAGPEGDLLIGALSSSDAPVRSYVDPTSLDRLLGQAGLRQSTQAVRRLWQVGMADMWLRGNEQPEYLAEVLEKST